MNDILSSLMELTPRVEKENVQPDHHKSLLYDTMIRPFLEPFFDITFHTVPKLIMSAVILLLMIVGTIQDLLATPKPLWVGLLLLGSLDFIAGTIRAIIDPEIKFSVHRWGRSAYKFTSYIIVILSTSIAGNMYPEIFGWFQYIVIAILVSLELYSISRHIKLTAVVKAAFRVLNQSGKEIASFSRLVDGIDKDMRKEKRDHEFNRDRMTDDEKNADNDRPVI